LRGWREGGVAGPEFNEAGVGCMVDIALGGFLAVGHGEQVKGLVRRGLWLRQRRRWLGCYARGVVGCWSRFGR